MKASWIEYGLSALLIVAFCRGFIEEGLKTALIGWVLIPAVFWAGFYWYHYWRQETKPLTRADKVLGVIAWVYTVSLLLPRR